MKILVGFVLLCLTLPLIAQEETKKDSKDSAVADDGIYRTPRAGKALKGTFLGYDFEVAERDRSNLAAIHVGASIYAPEVGDNDEDTAEDSVVPFAAFYYTKSWEDERRRIRMVMAGLANFIQFYEGSWNSAGLEFMFSFENYTIPFPSAIVVEGEELEGSEIYWGYIRGGAGFGWRTKVGSEFDNYFSVHALYEPGYLYFDDTDDTADNYVLPDSTYEGRIHLRVRYDNMERNIMELRHFGCAWGLDAYLGRRHKWKDHDFNGAFKKDDTQDYNYLAGYFTVADGPVFLSERHRFILSIHGGLSLDDSLDRYSAPQLGGGPGGDESEALSRSPIPGAKFNEFLVSRFMLITMEYRLEVLFFLYLHFKGVIGAMRRAQVFEDGDISLTKNDVVGSFSVAVTTGFVWSSQLYVEYSNDRGIVERDGQEYAHTLLVSWSKSF